MEQAGAGGRHGRAGLIMLAVAGLGAACAPAAGPGESGSSAGAGARPSGVVRPATPASSAGPTLSGTISVTGAHQLTAGFMTHPVVEAGGSLAPAPAGTTCAEYARGFQQNGGGMGFEAPVLHTTGSENVYVRASVDDGYVGPGRYASQTARLAGVAIVDVDGIFDDFRSTHGTTRLTVRPDGSGMLDFSDWRTSEVRGVTPGVDITGGVVWACH